MSMMKFRPVSMEEFSAALEEAVWAQPVEPSPEELAQRRRVVEAWEEEARERRREEEREEEAALERLRSLSPGFRPMAEMPFADLARCAYEVDGYVVVTDGEERTIVSVEKRCPPIREERELPTWWHEWELTDTLQHDSDGCHVEIGFVPTLWAPLPR